MLLLHRSQLAVSLSADGHWAQGLTKASECLQEQAGRKCGLGDTSGTHRRQSGGSAPGLRPHRRDPNRATRKNKSEQRLKLHFTGLRFATSFYLVPNSNGKFKSTKKGIKWPRQAPFPDN